MTLRRVAVIIKHLPAGNPIQMSLAAAQEAAQATRAAAGTTDFMTRLRARQEHYYGLQGGRL